MLTLTGHSGQVTSLAFAPDGRWLATAGWDGSVRLWERPSYYQARYLRTPYDHALTVAFGPDGRHLAMGFRNRDYSPDERGFGNLAWTRTIPEADADPDAFSVQDTWFAFPGATRLIAVHPNGQWLAAFGDSHNGHGRVLDPVARRVVRHLALDRLAKATDLAYSPDGSTLAVMARLGSESGTIYQWRDDERQPLTVPVRDGRGQSILFSPDGKSLFVGFASGRLSWWEMGRESGPGSTRLASPTGIVDMAFAPDGRALLLACEDGRIRLWDVRSREVRATYDWKIGTVRCIDFAPDGLTAAAGGDGVVLVWDVDN